jgi:hypothetical protein
MTFSYVLVEHLRQEPCLNQSRFMLASLILPKQLLRLFLIYLSESDEYKVNQIPLWY